MDELRGVPQKSKIPGEAAASPAHAQEETIAHVASAAIPSAPAASVLPLDASWVSLPSPILLKLENFFKHGLLAGAALEKVFAELRLQHANVQTSIDTTRVRSISLNCIFGKNGIPTSLYDKTLGAFSIMSEEIAEKEGSFIKSWRINKEDPRRPIDPADEEFKTLSQKLKRTALFLVSGEIPPPPANRVCREHRDKATVFL